MQKLFGYEDFLKYCKESGKRFVNELDREDFIAYRAEYSVPREQVELIKKLLDFQKQKTVEEIYSTQNIFEVPETMFRNEFNFSRPYISTADIKYINNKKFLLHILESMEEIAIEDLIGVTDEIISAVAETIRATVDRNGGWQAAQTFEDYEWLPQLDTLWNSFFVGKRGISR